MSDSLRQGPLGSAEATPWVIFGASAGGVILFALGWLGASVAGWMCGHGYSPPPFDGASFFTLLKHGPQPLWPHVPGGELIAGIIGGEGLGLALLVATMGWIWHHLGHPLGLARPSDVRHLRQRAMAKRAKQMRPSLSGPVPLQQIGILLGRMGRRLQLFSSWEDVILAIMGPRAGKTAGIAVPAILAAPGAVMATSNRADVMQITKAERAKAGKIWQFDPQGIAFSEQTMWWDMISQARTVEGAQRLAGCFVSVAADASYRHDFWFGAARNTLTSLLHAAAVGGYTVLDVLAWLANPLDRDPIKALEEARMHALAAQLTGTIAGAPETRDGIYETSRQCVACLLDPRIAAWVTPQDNMDRFDPIDFVTTRDTLYLLSKDGGGSAAGLVTAATDAVLQAAIYEAECQGGRIDPPFLPMLDECANIARIEDLPDLYSHLGSRSIPIVSILQSYRQGVKAWGEAGMDAMWSAATTKLLGAGLDDADFAAKISLLIGDHEIWRRSTSFGGSSGHSNSVQPHDKRALQASDVRMMKKGTALLLATGTRIARITLFQWHQGKDAARLGAAAKTEQKAIQARAIKAREARR